MDKLRISAKGCIAAPAPKGSRRPILLKNSFAVARLSVVEKVDPLERSQSDASDPVDGLRPPNLLVEKREASFSTE
jgi:hypothetical protein